MPFYKYIGFMVSIQWTTMRTRMYVCIKTSIHRNIIVNVVLRRNKLIGIKLQQ